MYFPIFILALLALMFVGFGIGGANAFKRKLIAALCTSILAVATLNIVEPVPSADGGLFLGIIVYSIFIAPVIFFYGIIASIVSDKISLNAKKYTNLLSLIFHILFGLLFILPFGFLFEGPPFLQLNPINILTNPLAVLGAIFAVTFFAIDSIMRIRSGKSSINGHST